MMQQQAMNRELPVPYAPDETGYYMPREESREESRGEVWVYGEPVPGGQAAPELPEEHGYKAAALIQGSCQCHNQPPPFR